MFRSLWRVWTNSRNQASRGINRERLRSRPAIEALEDRAVPSTFTVTNVLDSGAGSLRAAITAVNRDTSNTGTDVINFNIHGSGTHTISLLSSLPTIKHSVFINGGSQPGYASTPLIVLDGSRIGGGGGDGLVMDARGYKGVFTGQVADLAVKNFGDGLRVLDTGSSTTVNATLNGDTVTPRSGGDGIQVLAGTGKSTFSITNNQVTTTGGGDGIVGTAAGSAASFSILGNNVTAKGGGDGIQLNGQGTGNVVTLSKNTVSSNSGGDAMALLLGTTATTSATISHNTLSTAGLATGLTLDGGSHFQALLDSNKFTSDLVGIDVFGNGTTAGVIDMGGGSLGSTGKNDFTSFSTANDNSYAIGLFNVSSGYTMHALHNLFSVTDPTHVIADGTHDVGAGGSGTIDV
jgi:hypothetical protein